MAGIKITNSFSLKSALKVLENRTRKEWSTGIIHCLGRLPCEVLTGKSTSRFEISVSL